MRVTILFQFCFLSFSLVSSGTQDSRGLPFLGHDRKFKGEPVTLVRQLRILPGMSDGILSKDQEANLE